MIIKRGIVVSHSGALEWGAGKVVEVGALKATIQFSDGIVRKIASSHYAILEPADPASFVAVSAVVPAAKPRVAAKRVKKVKQPTV